MATVLVTFEEVGTNRRVLVNFDQVTRVQSGGKTCVVHYSDGSHTTILATFDEVLGAVSDLSPTDPKVGV